MISNNVNDGLMLMAAFPPLPPGPLPPPSRPQLPTADLRALMVGGAAAVGGAGPLAGSVAPKLPPLAAARRVNSPTLLPPLETKTSSGSLMLPTVSSAPPLPKVLSEATISCNVTTTSGKDGGPAEETNQHHATAGSAITKSQLSPPGAGMPPTVVVASPLKPGEQVTQAVVHDVWV
jgi:hypothetical protein